MKIDEQAAAVDVDFLCNICETKRGKAQAFDLIVCFFKDFQVHPIIHPLVYKKEILKNDILMTRLFEHEVIWQPTFEDILLGDRDKKNYYSFLVNELYFKLSGKNLKDAHVLDVFVDWVREQNLGEIHSISMCLICKCGIFLSDDNHSKKLQKIVKESSLADIKVYNRREVCNKLQEDGETAIKRDDLRALSHRV